MMAENGSSENKEEWIKRIEAEGRAKSNPTEDHDVGLKTLQNPIRRNLARLLSTGPLSLDFIQNELDLSKSEAKFHIDMLENALYVDKVAIDGQTIYQLSPRGAGFLKNVRVGGKNE
ncbi:DNA-binding transcriptional ArsR family regulator [Methanohalophilus levihalophilus]|uniref:winged helix-turn-helix domain-containing protein n=1 Tax=Methanohalophilus levihalophilus TaxID=1431282 RepID=UPI001FDA5F03|nr:winged helix-turn-helix domain-containing protein [Methanohalophilus levihalophilus]MBP2030312.1 DNA-binding transcriptional ArsR family regulator [Methanohalophilus levihalophilus]